MHRHTLHLAFAVLGTCFALGCALGNKHPGKVLIDDGRTAPGPQIAAVDGRPPQRNSDPWATVVPHVIVEPGMHLFTLDGLEKSFVAKVQAGKTYHTEIKNGVATLVEDSAERAPSLEARK